MQMQPLSRSHLAGSATSVKHEEVLKFETPVVENAWTLPQRFRTWLAFFFSQANTTAVSLQFPFPCPQCSCIQLLLQRDLAFGQFLSSLEGMEE